MSVIKQPLYVKQPQHLYEFDLIDFSKFENQNHNYKYTMNVIDDFSKFVVSIHLETKSEEQILIGLVRAFKEIGEPYIILSDKDSIIQSSESIQQYLQEKGIRTKLNRCENKDSIRYKLRDNLNEYIINKYITNNDNNNWVNNLEKFINKYNNTTHPWTKMKPNEAKKIENMNKVSFCLQEYHRNH